MKNLKLVEGIIHNLKIEDSKIHPLKNLDKQAMGTALLGTLVGSSVLISNAPIMLMAAKGIAGKTFTCEINDIKVIGQFTTVKFIDGTPLVMVISNEKEQGRHLAYAVLDYKKGVLYMLYGAGRSIKKGYKELIRSSFIFFIVLLFLYFISMGMIIYEEGWSFFSSYDDILFYGVGMIAFAFLFAFLSLFLTNVKDIHMLGKHSEQIFEKLGFEQIKNQDFYLCSKHDGGISVLNYRENLIGKDPYPEDYFDKNEKN